MLIQHLLTERIFRTVFNNPDFTRRNVIAAEIEKVIDALTSQAFSRRISAEARSVLRRCRKSREDHRRLYSKTGIP